MAIFALGSPETVIFCATRDIGCKCMWRTLVVITILSTCCYVVPADSDKSHHMQLGAKDRLWVEVTLRNLSLDEKIGQLLQLRYYGSYTSFDSPEYRDLQIKIQKYHIGSLVMGMHFDRSGPIRVSAYDAARVANRLQADSKVPLLLAADIERGVASRLNNVPSFPWPMAIGAGDNLEAAEIFGSITAREGRAIGIHWAFAPVADVNSNPANPIVNDRSFGEDSQRVGAFVAAFIRGAHANGLLVTAKHFPGHGDTSVDSHRGISSVDGDLEHLEKFELPPFKRAIEAGVDAIMLAHTRVPAIDSDPDKIATVSAKVVKGLLRKKLEFKGLIITDALEMKGVTTLYALKGGSPTALAAIDAIKAGCDVIMIPTDLDGAFNGILGAVKSGEIPEARIDESVRRVLEMKAAVNLNDSRFVDEDRAATLTSNSEDVGFAQHVADESVTLVRDRNKLIPLLNLGSPIMQAKPTDSNVAKHGLMIVLLAEALEETNGRELEREIRVRRPDAKFYRFDGRFSNPVISQLLQDASDAAQLILAAYVVHDAARQETINGKQQMNFGLRGPAGHLFEQMATMYPEKTAVIAFGSPYLIESFPQIQTYICTYSMATTSEISAVKAVFGEIQNHARLPITLPGVAPLGFSLPWPTQKDRQALQ
jgi:beta-N-acetylhexosaminidase